MVAQEMIARDVLIQQTAKHLSANESTLRYHLRCPSKVPDSRREPASGMDGWAPPACLRVSATPR